MPQTLDLGAAFEQLTEKLRELEQRVAALEGQSQKSASPAELISTPLQRPRPPATWRGFPPVEAPSGFAPVVGKAVLGIAGAYLLRAIAESSAIPKPPVVFVAILYACFWMVWAVRAQAVSRVARVTYALTSALILCPMLWESTVRFQVLSAPLASVVLVTFVVLTLALGWNRDLQLDSWIATLSAVITAIALIVATRELIPVTAALLAIALATEIAGSFGHRLTVRAIPAMAADFAIWLLIYILTAESLPEGYHPAAPAKISFLCLGLLAIYGGSIGVRAFALRQRITVPEIVQGVAAFALASFGTLRASQNSAAPELGILSLLFAALCYWGALSRFSEESQVRNRRVTATWAAALVLVGSFLLFPTDVALPFLCLAACATAFLYARTSKLSLGLHASFYLTAAAAVSPLPIYLENAFAGTVPNTPDWRIVLVALSALVCYLIGARHVEISSRRRLLWMVPALLVSFTVAAFVVVAAVKSANSHIELGASRLSVVRTAVNCVLALGLGLLGSHTLRAELRWLAYAAVGFGTLKLLFEDLRFGNAASLVVSLLFYGLVLILLPRLTRRTTE